MPVIKKKIKPDSVVYTDCLSSYDVLDVSEFRHVRINHSERFAERKNHINGIENFWSQAKRVLRKYNGIERKSFTLFLKECEFRFNYGSRANSSKPFAHGVRSEVNLRSSCTICWSCVIVDHCCLTNHQ